MCLLSKTCDEGKQSQKNRLVFCCFPAYNHPQLYVGEQKQVRQSCQRARNTLFPGFQSRGHTLSTSREMERQLLCRREKAGGSGLGSIVRSLFMGAMDRSMC